MPTFVAANATPVASAGANISNAAPAGWVAGDLELLMAGAKPETTALAIATNDTAGTWTPLFEGTGGVGVAGVGTGPMKIRMWWRIPTVAPGTVAVSTVGGNVAQSLRQLWRKADAAKTWAVDSLGVIGDAVHNLSFTAAAPTFLALTGDDVIFVSAFATASNVASAPVITATGGTFTTTLRHDVGTTTGNDMRTIVVHALLTGTTTAAPTLTLTHAANNSGVMGFARLREVAATGPVTVTPTGIASTELLGTQTLRSPLSVNPTGLPSVETVGTLAATVGNLNSTPTGITSNQALGTHTATLGGMSVTPNGVPSTELLGTHSITETPAGTVATPTGITTTESLGVHLATLGAVNTTPNGINSAQSLGAHSVTPGTLILSPVGISTGQSLGTHGLVSNLVISPVGLNSVETLGTNVINASLTASPTGINSAEAFGTHEITQPPTGFVISPTGIGSSETLGLHTATVGAAPGLTVNPNGITSAELFGAPAVAFANLNVEPTGVTTSEVLGAPSVALQAVIAAPNGIISAEQTGNHALILGQYSVTPNGIPSAELLGLPTVSTLTTGLVVSPIGISNETSKRRKLYLFDD